MKSASLFLGVLLVFSAGSGAAQPQLPVEDAYPELTARIESVRIALGIPGLAGALVEDGELVWAQGFGFADLENGVEATPNTPFGLASVTKPVAATLIMQLVEEGLIELDAPIADYGVSVAEGSAVTVRHLLTHTSEGTPGEVHSYNGDRYRLLGGVIEGATGRTFADLLGERFLVPLDMRSTALNPINSWGNGSGGGFEDFWSAVGWGESFEHYPDVYRDLASPYQFGADYEIVPGMYHLTHNPAAGLLSSAADLAAFDIALDGRALLSEAAMAEMFNPAVATVPGRSDVAYGLGWYVQEWADYRMFWHTGRWPPSTSALYLKLPDEGFTFIVLANTDNLTVPFPGIGSGDLSHSALMLTFFEQVVFDVPVIDWTAGRDELLAQLDAVDDAKTLQFLELELWSWRQALASSGDHDQAAVLLDVNRAAFPGSLLRMDDRFAYTAELRPSTSPVVSAAGVSTLAYLTMAWLVLTVLSLVVVVFMLLRPRPAPVADWIMALPAAVALGPFAVAAVLLGRRGRAEWSRSLVSRGIVAAVLSMTGYAVAWAVGMGVLTGTDGDPNPLMMIGAVLVLPFVLGLLVRVLSLRHDSDSSGRRLARRAVMPELMTTVLGVGALFAATLVYDNRLLSTVPHPTSPYFAGLIAVAAVVGVILLTQYYSLVLRRGMVCVPHLSGTAQPSATDAGVCLPRWRDSWWLLLVNIVVAVALVALVASRYG